MSKADNTTSNTWKAINVGYIRVSSSDQNTARQLDGLKLDRRYTDKASGKDTERPELQRLLADAELLGALGATLYVHSMDRLARSLADLLQLVKTLTDKGLVVHFVKEGQVFKAGKSDPMANLMLSLLGAVAEFERALIRERQREGITKAQAAGVYRGRTSKLTPEQAAQMVTEYLNRKAGVYAKDIAEKWGISRQTLHEYLKASQRKQSSGCALRSTGE